MLYKIYKANYKELLKVNTSLEELLNELDIKTMGLIEFKVDAENYSSIGELFILSIKYNKTFNLNTSLDTLTNTLYFMKESFKRHKINEIKIEKYMLKNSGVYPIKSNTLTCGYELQNTNIIYKG